MGRGWMDGWMVTTGYCRAVMDSEQQGSEEVLLY